MFAKFRRTKERKFQSQQSKGAPIIAHYLPKTVQAEQFRTIRTNLDFVNLDRSIKSLIVTSSIPAEGKSTIGANLAYVMAATEKKVLLVDADLRKPTVHRTFKINNDNGLSTVITKAGVNVNEVINYIEELNLYVLPSGPIPPNPSELLASAKMEQLMTLLKDQFDVIIYDTPPINAVTDAQILATKVDGVVLVVRQGYVTKEQVRHSKNALDNVNAKIYGYVMNDKELSASEGYYAYYGYSQED